MTKGDKYKAYYIANRERILEANRERAKARREALRTADEAIKAEHREKLREKEMKWRQTHYKATFEELAKVAPEWADVYSRLAALPTLHHITPTTMEFLTSFHTASKPQNIIIYSKVE